MKNTFVWWLLWLSLLGACQEWGTDKKVTDPQHTIDLKDTLEMNKDTFAKEYEKAGSRWVIHKNNQSIIGKITINEGTIYPEIEKAMLDAAKYNMEYKKDTIHGDSITSWWEKFLDMPVWCSFMLELINNKWVSYQDLLDAAKHHDLPSLTAKVFNRSYPEWPLSHEQELQKKEDLKAFIRMSLNACTSETYDIVDEQIFWIQTIRDQTK